MTIEDWLKLSSDEQEQIMQEEDLRYFLSELKESLPFRRKPGTKTVEYLRIGKSPLVPSRPAMMWIGTHG